MRIQKSRNDEKLLNGISSRTVLITGILPKQPRETCSQIRISLVEMITGINAAKLHMSPNILGLRPFRKRLRRPRNKVAQMTTCGTLTEQKALIDFPLR